MVGQAGMHTANNVYHKQPRMYLQSEVDNWWYQDITEIIWYWLK